MRDVFLNNAQQIKAGSEISLPVIIKMCQYNNNEGLLKALLDKKKDKRDIYTGFGNFGNLKFDFSIDCAHRPLKVDEVSGREIDINYESKNMQWINSVCHNSKFPTFRRSDLEDKFWILQIPDYGHQSMSAFYRDFVPHVYFDGKKVWQKYVGMIRQYSQRAAYILIDKDCNLKESFSSIDNLSNIIIRVCFKNNIEQDYSKSNSISLSKVNTAENNFVSYTAKDEDQNFLFSNQNRLNDNYEVYINNDTPLATSSYFFDFQDNELLTEDSEKNENRNTSTISMQTKEDYFRQSFINDYISLKQLNNNDNRVYDRPAAKRKLVVKVRFSDVNEAPDTIMLKSAENSYNAIYGNDISSIRHNTLRDFNCFKKDGSKFIPTVSNGQINWGDEKEIEIVPEHTNTRKYEWTLNSALSEDVTIPEILYSQYIYPWNLKNNTVLGYNNGSLVLFGNGNTISSGISIKDLIIYDDGEVDSTIESTNKTITGLDDLPSITTKNLNKDYEVITDPYLLNDERKFNAGSENNESGVFTYNKDDASLIIDENEPWHSRKDGVIQFNYNTNKLSNKTIIDNIKNTENIEDSYINKINSIDINYKQSVKEKDKDFESSYQNLEDNILTMFNNFKKENNEPITIPCKKLTFTDTHKIEIPSSGTSRSSNDIIIIEFNNVKENAWVAMGNGNAEPGYFQFRKLLTKNDNDEIISRTKIVCFLGNYDYIITSEEIKEAYSISMGGLQNEQTTEQTS